MKKLLISAAIIISSAQGAMCQYSADWGKYLNDSVSDADFSGAEMTEHLVVDVKNAATNEEYVYVTGRTEARSDQESFCGEYAFHYGSEDDFIAKYDRCGNLQWFRVIGTDNDDVYNECGDFAVCLVTDKDAVTGSTNIYVAGYSYTDYDPAGCSECMPCGASNSIKAFSCSADTCVFQKSKNNEVDAFIAKYDENGNLLKWTYFGGEGDDNIIGISVFQHDVFITGTTNSNPGFIPAATPMFDSILSSNSDAFVAQLDANLCELKFFSYMGGPDYERSHAIRCFKSGSNPAEKHFYISGATSGDLLDTAYHPLNSFKGGSDDSFIALWKLNKATGVYHPQWLTYIGGKANDRDRELIIDKSNNAIITGFTHSPDFISSTNWLYPKSNFFDTTLNESRDAFIAKYDIAGNALWGTFYGGTQSDASRGLARYSVKSGTTTNYVVIAGGTKSTDLPMQPLHPPFEAEINGGTNPTNRDAFVAILTDPKAASEIQQLEFASFFGGKQNEWDDATIDYGPDLDMGGNKEIYLTFYTRSVNIEECITSAGYHYNSNTGGDQDGYLAKILNSTIPKQFNCTDFDWGPPGPERMTTQNIAVSELAVFPNPFAGTVILYLKPQEVSAEEAVIEIRNVYGQIVFSKHFQLQDEVLKTQILFDDIGYQGIYMVRVTLDNKIYQQQLVYQR